MKESQPTFPSDWWSKAWVYYDNPETGTKKQLIGYFDSKEAIDICSRPANTFNFVSGIGYRLEYDPATAKPEYAHLIQKYYGV
jgi:hypothetical protein